MLCFLVFSPLTLSLLLLLPFLALMHSWFVLRSLICAGCVRFFLDDQRRVPLSLSSFPSSKKRREERREKMASLATVMSDQKAPSWAPLDSILGESHSRFSCLFFEQIFFDARAQ